MKIATSTVSVNAAFLQEIKQDNEELHRLLEQVNRLCQFESPPPESRQELADLLDKLRDQLALHFALEEAYGYFEDSIIGMPSLSKKADELRSQHAILFAQLCDVVDDGKMALDAHSPRYVCRRISKPFLVFYHELVRHENQENELILEAFDLDVGVGD